MTVTALILLQDSVIAIGYSSRPAIFSIPIP